MLMFHKGTVDPRSTLSPTASDHSLPLKLEDPNLVFSGKQSVSLVTGRMETYSYNDDGDLMTQYRSDDENLEVLVDELEHAVGNCMHVFKVRFDCISLRDISLTTSCRSRFSTSILTRALLLSKLFFREFGGHLGIARMWQHGLRVSGLHTVALKLSLFMQRQLIAVFIFMVCKLLHSHSVFNIESFSQGFEFVPTYLFSPTDRRDEPWLVQPFVAGLPYCPPSPGDDVSDLRRDTLAAFSHWSLVSSANELVHTQFQGV